MSFRQGGRGGGGGGNSYMKTLPFGLGYSDVGYNHITEFPSIPLPLNYPISSRERSRAVTYIKFIQSVKDSPFYTGALPLPSELQQEHELEDEYEVDQDGKKRKKNKKKSSSSNAMTQELTEDGFNDGIERYSDRYLKKRKITTSIDDHPYHLEIFPKELYSVMGINKKKLLNINKFSNKDDIFTGSIQDEKAGLSMLEKLKELAEDVDEDENADQDTKKSLVDHEDVEDDEFDDESDNDDYNGEKYFDNGDDDDYGDEEDGGDEPAF
ncbi:DNA-directed RNA polymerase III subunit C31 NDAI_0F03050 [Naumovozyma dairenensis CBS 421]|uniref:DNA-directed RNA polymerase III subunit n=1 Tax=Naumovozyma dairenensis (strain ATCC 10597 / BCRC 20456 / CBS 421 / NBRC 0211 / NRRL Y-12639) TaxID=1071378 RepID=G0WCW2_NAUDC|nr:hypothetical protein NDAI_0F03050 [Naumovozyma dairenensis CBS 421]CCD25623.1 hypothetical protein NDAI_0F03050 [Naumovozyma dairenensis CBS 421]